MRYEPLPASLFRKNRDRLVSRMKPGSIAIIPSNDIMPTSGDGVMPFVQSTDLFYLTGIDQEETTLVLFPDAHERKYRETLFIRESSESIVQWEGRKLTKEDAKELSGIEEVHFAKDFEALVPALVFEAENIYLLKNEHHRAARMVETRADRLVSSMQNKYPLHRYERLAPILKELRSLKSQEEIKLIKTACSITKKAFYKALSVIRPGTWEFEIEAEIQAEFLRNRSRRPAYESIIASGPNSCVLHYVKNDRRCREGEVVLMDFGAEYAGYASDLTRTVPVDGRFTPRQRRVYESVRTIQKTAIAMLKPGTTPKEYKEAVEEAAIKELVDIGLISLPETNKDRGEDQSFKKYFVHGVSHYLGLDVHDVGPGHAPFQAGMVFTCEPGIYIPEENLGIRIENDIYISESGPLDLTEEIPAEAEEIEGIMEGYSQCG